MVTTDLYCAKNPVSLFWTCLHIKCIICYRKDSGHCCSFFLVNKCPKQQRDDRSSEPCVGHNERQKGERQKHRAYKSERLFSVINMEMAEEKKACNCEISVQKALPALLPMLSFFSPFFFLAFSPSLPVVQRGLLIGSGLMRVNDRRIQASLWTKQIIIVRSEEVQRRSGNFHSCPRWVPMFGE